MCHKFSQQLRNQMIEYFQKYHSLVISDEQADEYLNSISELFLTFSSMHEEAPHPQVVREPPLLNLIISTH